MTLLCKNIRYSQCLLALVVVVCWAPAHSQGTGSQEETVDQQQAREVAIDPSTGRSNLGIAIQVPDYHGLEPKLSLRYSPSLHNGFVGVGWQLQGFSAIEQRGWRRGVPTWNATQDSDRYFLDGQLLVRSSYFGGTHTTAEEPSFVRISKTDAGTWQITQRDGTQSTYAPIFQVYTEDGTTHTYRWGLTKVEDVHGRVVHYRWGCEQEPGDAKVTLECYPKAVHYNGVTVKLIRKLRPKHDVETFALGREQLGKQTHRLTRITVRVGTQPGPLGEADGLVGRARDYRLKYVVSPITGRSLLKRVFRYGKTDTNKLPNITLLYQSEQQAKRKRMLHVPLPYANGIQAPQQADLNRDGIVDILFTSDRWGEDHHVALSNGKEYKVVPSTPALRGVSFIQPPGRPTRLLGVRLGIRDHREHDRWYQQSLVRYTNGGFGGRNREDHQAFALCAQSSSQIPEKGGAASIHWQCSQAGAN